MGSEGCIDNISSLSYRRSKYEKGDMEKKRSVKEVVERVIEEYGEVLEELSEQ